MRNARSESEKVLNFHARRRKNTAAYFTRTELNQLLGLYSEKLRTGVWRHATLDQRYGLIAYSVFFDPLDRPVYTFIKCDRADRDKGKYLLCANKKRIKQAHSMAELILYLRSL